MMADDEAVLEWVRARVNEFVVHLQRRYPDDPRAQALFDKLQDVQLLPDDESAPRRGSWRNGKFKHSVGTLFFAPRMPDGELRSQSSLLKTVVHELAHATRYKEPGEEAHSQQWKQTWLWFLSVATQDLGWSIDIKCAECTYYGLCERDVCPKCNWLQNLCKPYAGPPSKRR